MIPGVNQVAAIGAGVLIVAAGAAGFTLAWEWQDSKIVQCEHDFSEWVQEQDRILNEHKLDAKTRQQETSDAWAKNLEALRTANAGELSAYKRCVAAGRCGPVVPNRVCEQTPVPGGSGGAVPALSGVDGPGADAVPLAAECSETTLQLNALQADIERQPGYLHAP